MNNIYFWEGNVACAEGALIAGCRFFAGYPITPQSEILDRLAFRMPEVGGIFLQMEDELAAINSVIGASWAGAKAMTATSGPGFSLMQEGIGYAIMTETPCVIVNVQRAGPSTGQATRCAQGDFMQARWGRHGDQILIVLAPNSPQEMFDLTIDAFNLAEEYRTPVILLSDEFIAHMQERVEVPSKVNLISRRKLKDISEPPFGGSLIPPIASLGDDFNILVTGSTHDEYGYRRTADPIVHNRLVRRLMDKILLNADKIKRLEVQNLDNADIGIVSYGGTSRSVYEALDLANEKGIIIGHVRLKTLWPTPEKEIKALAERVKAIIVPEMSLGQLSLEVERIVEGKAKVILLSKIGGLPITPHEILSKIFEVLR